jgi:putative ABC transport system permease protein
MRLRRALGPSLRALLAHRMRTLLALSGVGVGVAAVIVSSAVGQGAQEQMARTIETAGTNLLIVKPLAVKQLVARQTIAGLATTLKPDDGELITALLSVADSAPAVEREVTVKAGAVAMKTTVRGTTPAFPSIRRFQMAEGRFFDTEDNDTARRVAVLGARVTEKIFGDRRAVGQEIRIRGVPFAIIGLLEAKGTTAEGADQDNQVLVPIQTAARRIFNTTWLTAVYVSVTVPEQMDEAELEIQRLLRARHQRGLDSRTDDFSIQNTAKIRSVQQEMTQSLSRFGAGLAGIALLVGGVGILALMLLSVRERASEIGLRMAVGARPRDILIQFLAEATALSLGGWIGGMAVGGAAALAVARFTTWTVGVPVPAVLASFAMAVIIGLGFGVVPARNASRIPPIEALSRT